MGSAREHFNLSESIPVKQQQIDGSPENPESAAGFVGVP
jgi:hypothetical protein